MYGEEWAGCSADWYSAVDKDLCLSVFDVNFLQLQALVYLICERGGSNLQQS